MKEGEFLFRKNFYECCCRIKEPALRLAIYESICEYGLTEECHLQDYPITEQQKCLAETVLRNIFLSIDNTKERYKRAVENGRKGGLKGGKLGGRGNKKKESDELTNTGKDI